MLDIPQLFAFGDSLSPSRDTSSLFCSTLSEAIIFASASMIFDASPSEGSFLPTF